MENDVKKTEELEEKKDVTPVEENGEAPAEEHASTEKMDESNVVTESQGSEEEPHQRLSTEPLDDTFQPSSLIPKKEPNTKLMWIMIVAAVVMLVVFIGVMTRKKDPASDASNSASSAASTAATSSENALDVAAEISYEDETQTYGLIVEEAKLYWVYEPSETTEEALALLPQDKTKLGLETASYEGATEKYWIYPLKEGTTGFSVVSMDRSVDVPVSVEVTSDKMLVKVGVNKIEESYSVSFHTETEKNISPILGLKPGDKIQEPEELTREGYTFIGWMEPDSKQLWDFEKDEIKDRNVTLMAVWLEGNVQPIGEESFDDPEFHFNELTMDLESPRNDADMSRKQLQDAYDGRVIAIKVKDEIVSESESMVAFSYFGPEKDRYQWNLTGASGGFQGRQKQFVTDGTEYVADRIWFYPKTTGQCLMTVTDQSNKVKAQYVIVIDENLVMVQEAGDDVDVSAFEQEVVKADAAQLEKMTKRKVTIDVSDRMKESFYEKDGFLMYEGFAELYDAQGFEHAENIYQPRPLKSSVMTLTITQDLVYQRGGAAWLKEQTIIYSAEPIETKLNVMNFEGDVIGSFELVFTDEEVTLKEIVSADAASGGSSEE